MIERSILNNSIKSFVTFLKGENDMTSGIYKITNILSNQSYIGRSINIEKRWLEHIKGKGNKQLK